MFNRRDTCPIETNAHVTHNRLVLSLKSRRMWAAMLDPTQPIEFQELVARLVCSLCVADRNVYVTRPGPIFKSSNLILCEFSMKNQENRLAIWHFVTSVRPA